MNEIKKLSSDKIKIENGLEVSRELIKKTISEYSGEILYEFDYYEVLIQDDTIYKIDFGEYSRIFNAISGGAKFVSINEDLVNINFIRRFKKKVGFKKMNEIEITEKII